MKMRPSSEKVKKLNKFSVCLLLRRIFTMFHFYPQKAFTSSLFSPILHLLLNSYIAMTHPEIRFAYYLVIL